MQEQGATSQLVASCYKEHSRLAKKLGKYGKPEATLEGFLFEAIPIAVTEWVPSKGSACTVLFKVAQRLIVREVRAQTYRGTVKVPYDTANRYEGCEWGLWCDGILEEDEADRQD